VEDDPDPMPPFVRADLPVRLRPLVRIELQLHLVGDPVVLADDPHTVDVEKIKDIQIVRTVVGGTISHQA